MLQYIGKINITAMSKIIVVSAVNLVEAGPLSILRQCLECLNSYVEIHKDIEVVAFVHKSALCYYPNISYIEIPWAKKTWLHRLYFEYVYLKKKSKKINAYLWLSLHDISPNVYAKHKAVYCHNASPFSPITVNSIKYNYKEFLFALFYKYLYAINIHGNDYVIVQQFWLKQAFIKLFNLEEKNVVVARAEEKVICREYTDRRNNKKKKFFYPAFPRAFKNFEIVCEASRLLEGNGDYDFEVVLTLDGSENKYSKCLYKKYSNLRTVSFVGLLPREKIFSLYEETDCLLFPSKLETWGLPISEFSALNRPMLISDLPFAHETAMGAKQVCFFNPLNAVELAERMKEVISGNFSHFVHVSEVENNHTAVSSWNDLFNKLLECND